MQNNVVIVLGNDHTNTLGLVQSVGKAGYKVYACVWGLKTGIVKASRYLSGQYSGKTAKDCVDLIISNFQNLTDKAVILCSCDGAALEVERQSERLKEHFLFEHATNEYSISQLQEKNLQVYLAEKAGFNTPVSLEISDVSAVETTPPFKGPYIYKALKSVEGDKSDLTICEDWETLRERVAKTLLKTPRVLVQKYVERDYEISILGCRLKDGRCIIPAVENKLTLFPPKVGLECLAMIEPLTDNAIIQPIVSLLECIGYVGLFSVEMMHSAIDRKYYFTEINLRNDGANAMIFKYGVNLPLIHTQDLMNALDENLLINHNCRRGYYIWEMHHFYSFIHRYISPKQWIKEIYHSKGFLVFDKKDPMPFIKQFIFPIVNKFRPSKSNLNY